MARFSGEGARRIDEVSSEEVSSFEVDDAMRDWRESRSSTVSVPIIIGSLIFVVVAFLDWIDGRELALTDPNGFQTPDGRVALEEP